MLGKLDDKIEMNRRMNETSEEMAQAPFKSVLSEFPMLVRSDGFADTFDEQVESPCTRVLEDVEEWRILAAEREVLQPRLALGEARMGTA